MKEIKFRAWDGAKILYDNQIAFIPPVLSTQSETLRSALDCVIKKYQLMQYTGLKDKNGKEIYEGDIIGEEGVYHFLEREGWEPSIGNWKIIGEKSKNFTGEKEEKYIAGYELRIVEWEDKSCGFEPFSDSRENCGHCGGGRNPNDYEVIGNIYQNPDLLK